MSALNSTILGQYLERFDGLVEAHYAKNITMQNIFKTVPLTGTNALTRRLMGGAVVQGVDATNTPDATQAMFDKLTVYVDTIALVRERVDLLGNIQADFDLLEERAYMHANEQAKFYDEAHFIALIKGAMKPANATVGIKGGRTDALAPGDEEDPDALYEAIENMLTGFSEDDISTDDFTIYVRPKQYTALNKANYIANRDFSDGGDVSKGMVNTILNVPIKSTARIPNEAIVGHPMSNVTNANFFDLSAAEAKAKVIMCSNRALIVPEAIALEKNIFYEKLHLAHYVDTMQSFGVGIARQDMIGCVFSA